jgi:hypothetical protein
MKILMMYNFGFEYVILLSFQGYHFTGKPGKVRETKNDRGKVRD